MRLGLELHVLEHRTKLHRVPDVRFLLLRELDHLGVAAAFDVEDTVIAPAMLVVADEETLGIRRQRRLPGSR
jgi:hypothetical protein